MKVIFLKVVTVPPLSSPMCVCVCLSFGKVCVVMAVLQLAKQTRLVLNLQRSTFLCLLNVAWLFSYFVESLLLTPKLIQTNIDETSTLCSECAMSTLALGPTLTAIPFPQFLHSCFLCFLQPFLSLDVLLSFYLFIYNINSCT